MQASVSLQGWHVFIGIMLWSVSIHSQTSLFISGSKSVYIKSATVSANGHITNNGTLSGTSAGVLNLNGTSTQNINGSAVNRTTVGKININNTNGVNLGTNVDVIGTTGLDFIQGPITLNSSNIRFASGSTWANNNTSTKFFITNGIGLVSSQHTGSAVTYPVGVTTGATNYTPITLTNAGTADAYGVRAQSGFRTSYSSTDGSPTGSLVNTFVVNVTWVINEAVAGGSNLTTQIQWNSSNETTGFNRNLSMVGYYRYSLTNWLVSTIGGVTGSGPYSKTFSSPSVTTYNYLPVTVGNSLSPLPIELLDFHVERSGNDGLIKWTTASEINNDHFEIERSLDAHSFEKIAVETGAGNSIQVIQYETTDNGIGEVVSGIPVYYRLKQVDRDGKFSYSSIQQVIFESETSTVIYPNPSKGDLTINYTAPSEHEVFIRVIDILGAVVKETKMVAKKGDQNIQLDLNELANGHYKIMLIAPTGVMTSKIVISK